LIEFGKYDIIFTNIVNIIQLIEVIYLKFSYFLIFILFIFVGCSSNDNKKENIISIVDIEETSIKKIEVGNSIFDEEEKINNLINDLSKVELSHIESIDNIQPEKEKSTFIKIVSETEEIYLFVSYENGYIAVDYAPSMSSYPNFNYKIKKINQLKKILDTI
jgi:hypothetical protein